LDAKARDLNFLANEGVVLIPFFQRQYVWGLENWKDLFEDLADTSRTHFLGSLILKQMKKGSGDPNSVLVIDGQQRLTTLSLLLKALHDTLPDSVREAARASLRPLLFYKNSPLDSHHLVKIHHSRLDSEAFQLVIRAGIDAAAIPDDAPDNLILDAYRYFLTELVRLPDAKRVDLFNHLLNQNNKMLVVIDLELADNEQAIFDTINSAGVRLSAADIIKNALYQRAIELMGEPAAVQLYKEKWERPFMADPETIEFWDEERLTGRLKRDNLEILLHALAVIKGFFDPDAHTLPDLAARYKTVIEDLSSASAVESFANEVREYAELYRKHFIAIDSTTPLTFSDVHTRLLHILDVFQMSTLHPFILFALRERPKEASGLLARLERFVVRRIVAGHETKSFNKLAKELTQDPDSLVERLHETTDDDVRAGLHNISNKTAKLVLFWIELRRRQLDSKFDVKELAYNYSLEHVMPQKWSTYWPLPSTKPDGSSLTEEDARRERFEKIYWIGNMTLLTGSLNSSLRNVRFEYKITGDDKKKGMGVYGTLSVTRRDIIDPFDRGDKVWDEAKIEKRTVALGNELLAMWGADDPASQQDGVPS
jgi:uncharacterized protein DUF262/uncharacterized protein DUF1524